jgi:hypothetical protein
MSWKQARVILALLLTLAFAGPATSMAADDDAKSKEKPKPNAKADPAKPAGYLNAVILSVKGRVQWKPADKPKWTVAKVNEKLAPGAMVRTGMNSSLGLRVGKNATVIVDANTRLALPQILKDGQTLRTAITLTRGRADFKVDEVGLTNDFTVVTPSATLSVRGTILAILYGGFNGTEITGAPTNKFLSIEVQYINDELVYMLSGNAQTRDGIRHPTIAELIETFGPATFAAAVTSPDQYSAILGQHGGGSLVLQRGLTRNPGTDPRGLRGVAQGQSSVTSTINMFTGTGSSITNLDPTAPVPASGRQGGGQITTTTNGTFEPTVPVLPPTVLQTTQAIQTTPR